VRDIAEASRAQAVSVGEVNGGATQMEQVTHQNAASSEELSSTAEQLSAQAAELATMVLGFRLGEDDDGSDVGGRGAVAARAPVSPGRGRLDATLATF
jgi:methyl-accepting chemotaxis protein